MGCKYPVVARKCSSKAMDLKGGRSRARRASSGMWTSSASRSSFHGSRRRAAPTTTTWSFAPAEVEGSSQFLKLNAIEAATGAFGQQEELPFLLFACFVLEASFSCLASCSQPLAMTPTCQGPHFMGDAQFHRAPADLEPAAGECDFRCCGGGRATSARHPHAHLLRNARAHGFRGNQ